MTYFRPLVSKADKFVGLSWQERLLLLHAFVLLPFVALSLHLFGMGRTQHVLERLCPQAISRSPETLLLLQAKTTARMVAIAAHYSQLWTNCLKRSLVLWYLLRRQGIVSELRIGVQGVEKFQAHAWVEYQNIVLNDMPNVRQHFVMFERPFEVKF
jgi:hypothetical protein